ncbi:hypothetical protein [Brevundimonas sp.]|uniref:hypothetical protein n=1 Tax=Brevundimonas sp. TaxID=1871086 RepID=UPI00391D5F66
MAAQRWRRGSSSSILTGRRLRVGDSEASEAARRVFLKRGYAVVERRDFEVAGVAIHNYAMERRL